MWTSERSNGLEDTSCTANADMHCTYYGGGIYKRHCIEYMAET